VQGQWLGGQPITCIETICGVRFTLADGSWGLVRASSNKPELAVVCESPTSPAMLASVFAAIEDHLASYPEVGAFNQKLAPVA
jgi:phosphomannomutase/phosphoglucomutase